MEGSKHGIFILSRTLTLLPLLLLKQRTPYSFFTFLLYYGILHLVLGPLGQRLKNI